jgi:hypothetical protein
VIVSSSVAKTIGVTALIGNYVLAPLPNGLGVQLPGRDLGPTEAPLYQSLLTRPRID